MAFKLTYADGQESSYDDSTRWEVDAGVLKLGRESGGWTVLVSPGHWATIEIAQGESEGKTKKDNQDEKDDKDDNDEDDEDDKDEKDEKG